MNEFYTSNPSTGKPLHKISGGTPSGFDELLGFHKAALKEWRENSYDERIYWLRKIREVIVDHADEIGNWIAEEQGQPKSEAITLQIFPVLDTIKYLERVGKKELADIRVSHQQIMFSAKSTTLKFEPIGTILVIGPWNFSFLIPMIDAITAIFCGNTVIIKPSPFTAGVGEKIQQLLDKVGLPKHVVDVFNCDNSVAPYLVEHPGINKIIFTGSTGTGKKIMASASKNLTPVLLELGGKDPAVVTQYADIDRSVTGILWGCLSNAGQVCSSIERVYVHEKIYQSFIEKIKSEIENLTIGDAFENETQIGPMINESQLSIVEAHVLDAIEKGAKLIFGGKRVERNGYYFLPTIISDVDHSMKIMSEETFGPVIAIQKITSIEEGVRLSNQSEYGLNASLWSNNREEIAYFSKHIESGGALVNDHIVNFDESSTPWGGVKKSAVGRTHSKFGLYELVNIKVVSIDHNSKPNQWWYPYDAEYRDFLKQVIPAIYSISFSKKIRYTIKLFMNKRFLKRLNWSALLLGIKRWF